MPFTRVVFPGFTFSSRAGKLKLFCLLLPFLSVCISSGSSSDAAMQLAGKINLVHPKFTFRTLRNDRIVLGFSFLMLAIVNLKLLIIFDV